MTPISTVLRNLFSRFGSAAASPKRGKLCFETLEPRVLLSGDVNPSALAISGSIAVPGEQDAFVFTVEETTRVVIDSLTNNSSLTWKLDGPAGQLASQSFTSTDPALELTAGKYQLTVDASGDVTGSYGLRLIDAATAADLAPGQVVSDTLDGGNNSNTLPASYSFNLRPVADSEGTLATDRVPIQPRRQCAPGRLADGQSHDPGCGGGGHPVFTARHREGL